MARWRVAAGRRYAGAQYERHPGDGGWNVERGDLPTLRLIGPGRAGRSLTTALARVGWDIADPPITRGEDVSGAAHGVDALLIAVPDGAIAAVARSVGPVPDTVVLHMAGSRTLDVLAPHPRRASVHPLCALADPDLGADHLSKGGVWYAVSGDPLAHQIVKDVNGRAIDVDDEDRAVYHAAAVIASNHLVALLAQVERVAKRANVPLAAYFDLVRQTVDNVERLGPAEALTGPVKRNDWDTIEAHLAALPEDERPAYEAMAREAVKCT